MEQIGNAIRWMKKNGFWLGCFFMSALMIGIWCFRVFLTIDVATQAGIRGIQGKINTAKAIHRVSADGVEGTKAHPNASSEEGIRLETSQTVESIIEAWEKRVRDQKEILKWPTELIGNNQFETTFSQYNPPELIPEKWKDGGGVLDGMLSLYGKNIPKQMVVLTGDNLLRTRWNFDPDRLEAEKMANAQTAQAGNIGRGGGANYEDFDEDMYGGAGGFDGSKGAMGNGRETPGMIVDKLTGELIDMNSYAVIWHQTNQELWQTKMTSFKGRDDNRSATNIPTPLQCYMLQQDLWLLEAMFRIIREVNGDADANDISTIKRLDHVVFGRDVGGKLGMLTPFDPRLGAIAAPDPDVKGDETFMGVGGSGEGNGGPEDSDMVGEGTSLVSPYEKRYVDLNFEPLAAEKVKSIIESPVLPEEDLELIVSKRVPVRIAVRMKETEIATFMAACANSPFAFEIQQVRWNRHIPGEEIKLGGSGDAARGFAGQAGRAGMSFGDGSGADFGTVLKSTPVEIRTNYDVDVEFYGIVKIYNPVRPKVLRAAAGLDGGSVDPNDAASVVSAQPGQSTP